MTSPSPQQELIPATTPMPSAPSIDGKLLKKLAYAGLTWLNTNQQTINSLNVFPVPDGDTGTNMSLTMQAACQEIAKNDSANAGQIAHSIAHGALMGARGNSGVIFSQIWRGIARSVDAQAEINAELFARALKEARETAYKGVVRPVEGTILTVASDIAIAAEQAHRDGCQFPEIIARVVAAADQSVQRTPELLPVLQQAGVVDAGGKGLFFFLEGMQRWFEGKPLDKPLFSVPPLESLDLSLAEELVEEGQDFEIVVDFIPSSPLDMPQFYANLEQMGTSIQIGQGDDLYRMHIHVPTDKRYEPIDYILRLGTVSKVAMENLQEQTSLHHKKPGAGDIVFRKVSSGQIAAIAVSPGMGLTRVFASLGISAVVPGGQTMNPSTKEILTAFADLPAEKIIILPNNKNIIMAAEQTKALTQKQIAVIPSRTIPQGIAAMLAFQNDGELEAVRQAMTKAIDGIQSGELTLATRSVEMNGVVVAEGQFIGLLNGSLVTTGNSLEESLLELLRKMGAETHELITLYWGDRLTPQAANQLTDKVRATFPSPQVESYEGGQPHYFFILSVE
ncbi:MAG: DAK2 domain-containing protein [Anaerolineales bacterium]|nr:DAK2 domain-containing protein [Anaerolineales bacterium]